MTTDIPPPDDYMSGYPQMPTNWLSNTDFDLGWISGLQSVANKTLGQIYGDYDEFTINPDDPLNFDHLDPDLFIDGSVGPITYLAIWTAILVFLAIVGLCCVNKCCCCCRSSFKGKNIDELENTDPNYQLRPYYSERNDGKRGGITVSGVVLSVLMGVWLVGFLIIILHTFASNDKTKEAVDRIQPDLDNAIADIDKFLSTTRQQLNHSFIRGFETLQTKLDAIVQMCDASLGCDESVKQKIRDGLSIGTGETGITINDRSMELNNSLVDVQAEMESAKKDLDENYEDVIANANDGLYWFFMLFNILYCVIFGLVLIGTVLAAYGRGSGIKTSGFLLIRGGIVLTFIVGIFVVLQLATMFILAGVSSEIMCPAIRELEKEPEQGTTDTVFLNQDEGEGGGESEWKVPNIGEILRACKQDKSAYIAFNLEKVYNVDEITKIVDNFNIDLLFSNVDTGISDSNGKVQTGLNPQDTIKAIRDEVSRYAEFVRDTIKFEMGNCKPAYLAINATVSLFCDKITAPVASYWFILQFLPLVFVLIFVTALFLERGLS